MTTTWANGNLTIKADEEVIMVSLNKASFGADLNQETSRMLRDFTDFLIASDARVQDLIRIHEVWEDCAND